MYIHWQSTPQIQLFTNTVNNQFAKSAEGQSNHGSGNKKKEYKGQEGGLSDRTWAEESRMLIKDITFTFLLNFVIPACWYRSCHF